MKNEEIKYEIEIKEKERNRSLSFQVVDEIEKGENADVFSTKYRISLRERGEEILHYEDRDGKRARELVDHLLEEARGWF